ncbi:MAG: hypothetical protein IPP29_03950 [Bacteroidetes bacterium]|nr:hypothetical protein [Bacteroidota bacterium]
MFIQLKSKDTKITAGDFDVVRPVSYFLSLQKRGQGCLLTITILQQKDSTINSTTAGAAISRGKFAQCYSRCRRKPGSIPAYRFKTNCLSLC